MTHYGDKRFSTPRGDAMATADVRILIPTAATLAMASDDTEYSIDIPEGATNIWFSLNSDSAWRFALEADEVASGSSFAVAATKQLNVQGPTVAFTLYAAHTLGSAQVLTVTYEVPASLE